MYALTHSSGESPSEVLGWWWSGLTNTLITTEYIIYTVVINVFLIRVPNFCGDTLIAISSIPQPPTSVSKNIQLSWLIMPWILWVGCTTWPIWGSSARQKFDPHQNAKWGVRNRTHATQNRYIRTRAWQLFVGPYIHMLIAVFISVILRILARKKRVTDL